jgi:hypothetical protein
VREDSLFSSQDLRSVLEVHIAGVIKQLELMSEDEVLRRSSDDLVEELVTAARMAVWSKPLLTYRADSSGEGPRLPAMSSSQCTSSPAILNSLGVVPPNG